MQVTQPIRAMQMQGFRPDIPKGIPPPHLPDIEGPHMPGPGQGPQHAPRFDLTTLFIFIMVIALSTSIAVTARWRESENRAIRAEAAKNAAELSFLKAQVNPHFLFNTLNNIYTLALTNSEHTAESIMRLSNIMRYVTDEGKDDLVPLRKEADRIMDYVALQRLRLGSSAEIELSIADKLEGFTIPPLILMSFVENAFKYGISKKYPSPIVIMLQIKNNQLYFYCNNKVHATQQERTGGGIGLANTKKRLDALFKDCYFLDIKLQDHYFTAVLTIDQ